MLRQALSAPLIDIGIPAREEDTLQVLLADCLSSRGMPEIILDPTQLSVAATRIANRNGIQMTHKIRREFETAYLAALQAHKVERIANAIISIYGTEIPAEEMDSIIKFQSERRRWVDLRSESGQARLKVMMDQLVWPDGTNPPKDWLQRANLIGMGHEDFDRVAEVVMASQTERNEDQGNNPRQAPH